MFAKEDLLLGEAQFSLESASHPELVDHPGDHRFAKHFPGFRIGLQDRHQNAVKLPEGLFEEDDVVDVSTCDAGAIQTELDRISGIPEVMLHAGEALFFGGSDELAIAKESCGRGLRILSGSPRRVTITPNGKTKTA